MKKSSPVCARDAGCCHQSTRRRFCRPCAAPPPSRRPRRARAALRPHPALSVGRLRRALRRASVCFPLRPSGRGALFLAVASGFALSGGLGGVSGCALTAPSLFPPLRATPPAAFSVPCRATPLRHPLFPCMLMV